MTWIDWRELETTLTLEQLPDFHRAFLDSRGIKNTETMMLRRVQQSVERELNTMLREQKAKEESETLFVSSSEIPSHWLEFVRAKKT